MSLISGLQHIRACANMKVGSLWEGLFPRLTLTGTSRIESGRISLGIPVDRPLILRQRTDIQVQRRIPPPRCCNTVWILNSSRARLNERCIEVISVMPRIRRSRSAGVGGPGNPAISAPPPLPMRSLYIGETSAVRGTSERHRIESRSLPVCRLTLTGSSISRQASTRRCCERGT